ncbi:MAG: hypothetical protein V5789_04350 [Colwellia sp.]
MSTGELCDVCTDSEGNLKSTYESKGSAKLTVDYIEATEGKKLRIYECPQEKGWHLTKSTNP